MIDVTIELIRITSRAPRKAHMTDACFDLFSDEEIVFQPHQTKLVPLGFKVQLPVGYEAQIRPRSGHSMRGNFEVVLGTIDEGYRGEVHAIVRNLLPNNISIERGTCIAQMKISQVPRVIMKIGKINPISDRGENGFGSSDQ